MSRLFVFIQYLLPHHGLSRLTGFFASGRFLKNSLIRLFVRRYKVDLSEAEISEVSDFENFNAFFTRALKPGARPLALESQGVLCPADGAVSEIGAIEEDRILQAKGRYYTTAQLLGDEEMAEQFYGGSFATIYLSPRDYHRVHMPLEGKLIKTLYVPGKLFSVNRVTANNVENLFARNERLVCLFETPAGAMAVVLVGAMIVAGIETVWAGQVCPNRERNIKETDYLNHSPPVQLATGAELGRFKLGSTAIVLFEPDSVQLEASLTADVPVQMGQLLARYSQQEESERLAKD
ncbi:MAG: archaetidylserine decarboxylase [Pseudomonadales bacterium]|nr:archaetidylserine decarboxylase [Pseudomonadales bacterium]